MVKSFFSLSGGFNIFNFASLIFIVLGLYNKGVFFILFGIYLDMFPRLYTSFLKYKETREIKPLFIVDIIIFIVFTIGFIYKFALI